MSENPWYALLERPELPELFVRRAAPSIALKALEEACARAERAQPPKTADPEVVRALVLLWHDHWEPAHQLVQENESREAAIVHAIVHRREPDFWNSKYWWRRVGAHPACEVLGRQIRPWLDQHGLQEWRFRLIQGGIWDPFAFVDVVESLPETDPSRTRLARQLQKLEFETLLAVFTGAAASHRAGSAGAPAAP